MKVLIAYRSKYGATAACARALAAGIHAETELADLSHRPHPRVGLFDAVLVGGSIYGGRIQREVTAFCERNEEELLQRPAGLFICCFYQGERAREQIREAFPSSLHEHAFARTSLGGELHVEKLTLLDRLLVRSLGAPARDIDLIRPPAIAELASQVNALSPAGLR